jgi:hypothetical protein
VKCPPALAYAPCTHLRNHTATSVFSGGRTRPVFEGGPFFNRLTKSVNIARNRGSTAAPTDPPGSPGVVGPNPRAYNVNASPRAAGLAAVTGLPSRPCTTAGPPAMSAISGRSSGVSCRRKQDLLPPFTRRFAGSSVIEACVRGPALPPAGAVAVIWPRAP